VRSGVNHADIQELIGKILDVGAGIDRPFIVEAALTSRSGAPIIKNIFYSGPRWQFLVVSRRLNPVFYPIPPALFPFDRDYLS